MINCRTFIITGIALALVATPLATEAQQKVKVPRVGVLADSSPEATHYIYGLRQGLRDLGYVEGQNIVFEWRWAQGRAERFDDFAAELVRLKVDVIVAGNNDAVAATQKATRTSPVVMVIASDPVGSGFVTSLARPGGNITGLTLQSPDVVGKRLQLLKEAAPNLRRVAVLWDPEPGRRALVREAKVAAPVLGMQVQPVVEARSPSEIDSAFAAMTRERAGAVLIIGSAMLFTHRARIGELAAKSRLPTMSPAREWIMAGQLMSYGPSFTDLARRASYFVDKILKGAKPADLPVEQPTKFELVINMKTAKALGLTIPQSLLFQADRVIK